MNLMKLMGRFKALAKTIIPIKPFLILFFSIAGLLSLYSCTMQQEQTLLSAKSAAGENTKRVLQSTPFAYDIAADTISYNSCVGTGLNSNGALHGIKIGANEGFADSVGTGSVKGGLKLSSEFLQYIASNVDPTFPNTSVSPSQIQYILENTDFNKDLKLQVAVRYTSNLYVAYDKINPNTTTVTLGLDGKYLGGFLAQEPILTYLTKNVIFGTKGTVLAEGPRIYNVGSASSPEPIEAALGYSNITDDTAPIDTAFNDGTGIGEQYSDAVRQRFNSFQYILAITYGSETTVSSSDSTISQGLNSLKRPSETDLKKAFGKGYELNFISKNPAKAGWRSNLLNRVTEKNLANGQTVTNASWGCENFVIMRTNQFNNKKISEPSCSELTTSDLNDPTIAIQVKKIRRHYPENLWGVGLMYGANEAYIPAKRIYTDGATIRRPLCLANKQVDCYLSTNIIPSDRSIDVGIQYDSNQECYLSRFAEMGVTYTGNLTGDAARRLGRCAQYASICIRSSTGY